MQRFPIVKKRATKAGPTKPIELEEVEVAADAPEGVDTDLTTGSTFIIDELGSARNIAKLSAPGRGEKYSTSKKFEKWLRKQPKDVTQIEIDDKRDELGLPVDNRLETLQRRRKEFKRQELEEVIVRAGERFGTLDGMYPNTPEGRQLLERDQKERVIENKVQNQNIGAVNKLKKFFNDFYTNTQNLDINQYHEEYSNLINEEDGTLQQHRDEIIGPIQNKYIEGILKYNQPLLDNHKSKTADKYNLSGQQKDIYNKTHELNKDLINSIEEQLLRDSGIPLTSKNGKLYLASDPNSPQTSARLEKVNKEINNAINSLVTEALKKDNDYVQSIEKYNQETKAFENDLIKKGLDDNIYYKSTINAIDNTIKAGITTLDKKRVEAKYGDGITGEVMKWAELTVPSMINDTEAGGLKSTVENLKAERERIEAAPEGSMVSYGERKYTGGERVGLGGAITRPASEITRENALADINKKIDAYDKKLFDKLIQTVDFQKELALFDRPEMFDKDGLTWSDAKKIVGEQALNVFGTILSLGLYTPMMEGTAVMKEILSVKAAANLGISVEKFNRLSSKKQARAMADVDDANLATAVTVGLGAGALDAASTVMGARAIISKMPKGLLRAWIRDGYLSPASKKIAKEQLKRGG